MKILFPRKHSTFQEFHSKYFIKLLEFGFPLVGSKGCGVDSRRWSAARFWMMGREARRGWSLVKGSIVV